MVLYHGTSTTHAARILTDGLTAPSLTCDRRLAEYYADVCCDTDGGDPVILAVTVTDPAALTVDVEAINEPVMCCQTGDRYKQSARNSPGLTAEEVLWQAADVACDQDGVPGWSELSWQRSLKLTCSALSTVDIPAGQITRSDDEGS